jgi:predicted amidohydrolase
VTVVSACQLRLAVGQVAANRARAREAIEAAAAGGAELIVLPELTPTGYVFRDAAEARVNAETSDGPTSREWQELAARHGVVIVGGFCEIGPGDTLFNSALIIDRGQLLATYRKAHLWDDEKRIFAPGDQRPPVLDTSVGRIATMICYDLEFPEWMRLAALAGAELLAAPTNWPLGARPNGERPMEVVRVQASASVNRIFIVAADRCGEERGVDWVGGTVIVDPDGFPLAGPVAGDDERIVYADVDLRRARDKKISPQNDVLADRRVDLYSG